MGITAEDIVTLKRTITIDVGPIGFPGETVVLTYRPNYFDEDAERTQKQWREADSIVEPLYSLFLSAVTDWDILKVKGGDKVPLTMEGLKEAKIASKVIGFLWSKMLDDYSLGEKSAADGSTGSLPAAVSENHHQTGPGSE